MAKLALSSHEHHHHKEEGVYGENHTLVFTHGEIDDPDHRAGIVFAQVLPDFTGVGRRTASFRPFLYSPPIRGENGGRGEESTVELPEPIEREELQRLALGVMHGLENQLLQTENQE